MSLSRRRGRHELIAAARSWLLISKHLRASWVLLALHNTTITHVHTTTVRITHTTVTYWSETWELGVSATSLTLVVLPVHNLLLQIVSTTRLPSHYQRHELPLELLIQHVLVITLQLLGREEYRVSIHLRHTTSWLHALVVRNNFSYWVAT